MWVNAARTSTRGLETGTLWIGECTVLLICLIFEWKHGLFQHGCIYQKLTDRNTSFVPYPLISWLISVNFDLLWYFFQPLWWGCGTDSPPCRLSGFILIKWWWQQLLHTATVICSDDFVKSLSDICISSFLLRDELGSWVDCLSRTCPSVCPSVLILCFFCTPGYSGSCGRWRLLLMASGKNISWKWSSIYNCGSLSKVFKRY